MNIKSIILPAVVAVILSGAVCFWVYEYHRFKVQPRIAGQDGRPQITQQEAAAQKPEGTVKEYMDWILSDVGQCIIVDKGYAPVRDVNCK